MISNEKETKRDFVKWSLTGATPANETAATTTFVMGGQDVTVDFEERLTAADQVVEKLPDEIKQR